MTIDKAAEPPVRHGDSVNLCFIHLYRRVRISLYFHHSDFLNQICGKTLLEIKYYLRLLLQLRHHHSCRMSIIHVRLEHHLHNCSAAGRLAEKASDEDKYGRANFILGSIFGWCLISRGFSDSGLRSCSENSSVHCWPEFLFWNHWRVFGLEVHDRFLQTILKFIHISKSPSKLLLNFLSSGILLHPENGHDPSIPPCIHELNRWIWRMWQLQHLSC